MQQSRNKRAGFACKFTHGLLMPDVCSKNMIQLWTWQEPDFSLTSGYVDHAQSEYYNTVLGVPEAYAILAKRLGTDQIIWCYVRRDEYDNLPHLTRIEWALDVPDDDILAIIDTYTWNRLLGIETYPRTRYLRLLRDAPMEETARNAHIEQQIRDYHSQPEPDGGWWSRLFMTDTTVEGATVLLAHPIPESWVAHVGTA
jgi:hypothetical protein